MTGRLKIGVVPYINARPLIRGLEDSADLVREVPSKLAVMLRAKKLDVALVPVIEYFSGTRYTIIPAGCISSDGPVMSVLLIHRTEPACIRLIALDADSLSSAALLKIIAAKKLGLRAGYAVMNVARIGLLGAERAGADAVLMIGDHALKAGAETGGRQMLDLGEAWRDLTGLRFVYAAWLARDGVDLGAAATLLADARRKGRERMEEVAMESAAASGLPVDLVRRYLGRHVRYDLGPDALAGVARFRDYCLEMGLIENNEEIRIHD